MTRDEIRTANGELEGQGAEAILRWAWNAFAPRLTFATGFGMEGCVIIDLMARQGTLADIFTLDTGLLFQETHDLWRRLEERYGISIRAVRPRHTVEEQAAHEGPALWSVDPDRCCELRKTGPLRATLASFDAWISAIRRDQTPDRADAPAVGWDGRFGLVKVNPLIQWTFADVQAHVKRYDVPYNPLHDRGYPSIGCWPCTTPVGEGEDPRSGRWRGREKVECGLHLRPPTE